MYLEQTAMNTTKNNDSDNYYKYLINGGSFSESQGPHGILVKEGIQIHIDQKEYGVPKAMPIHSVEFSPREMGILDKY